MSIDSKEVIKSNEYLVEKFVNLVFSYDISTSNQWFYTMLPLEKLKVACMYLTPDDLRQDLYLYILERAQNYERSLHDFNLTLRLYMGWYVRDRVELIYNNHQLLRYWYYVHNTYNDEEPTHPRIALFWVLRDDRAPLTIYERYILFLRLYRCYTIQQIAVATYQDRKSVQKSLDDAIEALRRHYSDEHPAP